MLAPGFPVAPILPGYVLGPMVENFRRPMRLARGDLLSLFDSPIVASVPGACFELVMLQIVFWFRGMLRSRNRPLTVAHEQSR